MDLKKSVLRWACFQQVREWAATAAPEAVLQSTLPRTPQTIFELANMLRDPMGRLRCPFGVDFEGQVIGAVGNLSGRAGMQSLPWWLALMELHGDGHRYGTNSDRELPCVFELLVAAVARKREAREAAPGGAAEHSLFLPDDLARALIANPVFRNKVGAHDLLVYALSSADGRLCEVTDEQLQHGDIIAASSLIHPAAADAIATPFFEFAAKHRLPGTMATMSSEQIQVLALFHSHLLRRPIKRVVISERLDLMKVKPAYIPASAVASPEVPHFARVACDLESGEGGDAAEHSALRTAKLQAPGGQLHAGLAALIPESQHLAARQVHDAADCSLRCVCIQRLDRGLLPMLPVEGDTVRRSRCCRS